MGLTGEGTSADELWELHSREAIAVYLRDLADERLAAKVAEVGEEDWKTVERLVLIRTIDSPWVEHLTELDDMRRGIGLRGYAQQDPLNEFKREAFQLYDELRGLIRHGVASSIFRVTSRASPPLLAAVTRRWPPRSPGERHPCVAGTDPTAAAAGRDRPWRSAPALGVRAGTARPARATAGWGKSRPPLP